MSYSTLFGRPLSSMIFGLIPLSYLKDMGEVSQYKEGNHIEFFRNQASDAGNLANYIFKFGVFGPQSKGWDIAETDAYKDVVDEKKPPEIALADLIGYEPIIIRGPRHSGKSTFLDSLAFDLDDELSHRGCRGVASPVLSTAFYCPNPLALVSTEGSSENEILTICYNKEHPGDGYPDDPGPISFDKMELWIAVPGHPQLAHEFTWGEEATKPTQLEKAIAQGIKYKYIIKDELAILRSKSGNAPVLATGIYVINLKRNIYEQVEELNMIMSQPSSANEDTKKKQSAASLIPKITAYLNGDAEGVQQPVSALLDIGNIIAYLNAVSENTKKQLRPVINGESERELEKRLRDITDNVYQVLTYGTGKGKGRSIFVDLANESAIASFLGLGLAGVVVTQDDESLQLIPKLGRLMGLPPEALNLDAIASDFKIEPPTIAEGSNKTFKRFIRSYYHSLVLKHFPDDLKNVKPDSIAYRVLVDDAIIKEFLPNSGSSALTFREYYELSKQAGVQYDPNQKLTPKEEAAIWSEIRTALAYPEFFREYTYTEYMKLLLSDAVVAAVKPSLLVKFPELENNQQFFDRFVTFINAKDPISAKKAKGRILQNKADLRQILYSRAPQVEEGPIMSAIHGREQRKEEIKVNLEVFSQPYQGDKKSRKSQKQKMGTTPEEKVQPPSSQPELYPGKVVELPQMSEVPNVSGYAQYLRGAFKEVSGKFNIDIEVDDNALLGIFVDVLNHYPDLASKLNETDAGIKFKIWANTIATSLIEVKDRDQVLATVLKNRGITMEKDPQTDRYKIRKMP